VYYGRSGWLSRLEKGVYVRPGAPLDLQACLRFLERRFAGLHVGGKTALAWQGIQQYVAQQPKVSLYAWESRPLPEWFLDAFPVRCARKRLFQEDPQQMIGVERPNEPSRSALRSSPERAWLEMLSEVGLRETLAEARELAESTLTFRSDLVQDLLTRCTSVKTVRLCLQLGAELALPWAAKLDQSLLPRGSQRPWVARYGDRTLVLH